MRVDGNPFLDPEQVRGQLYERADRLTLRSGALNRARTDGRYVPEVIVELAVRWLPDSPLHHVADIGCGRGSSTLALAAGFPTGRIIALDLSPALLAAAGGRLRAASHHARLVCADFHHMPLADVSCDLIVAAFCLYHAPEPSTVIAEMARCLSPDGVVILVTKSEDSYRELDLLVARAGLDKHAATRTSLYESVHTGNLPDLAARSLDLKQTLHHQHTFCFTGFDHIAEYLATSPKYTLPASFIGNPTALALALRGSLPDEPLTMSSTVTYLVAGAQIGRP
ncbi:MAG: class I SAM-dependent methyltransferase [Pseudonocardiaceae bacterium]